MRIGHGFDVHAFDKSRPGPIRLGGLDIPCDWALKAHSDGDVLLHALMDAMLGAAALGDIGHLFPDTDSKWKGADSGELLREVCRRVQGEGWQLGNCDVTVVAQSPRLAPHIGAMREAVARLCDVEAGCVSIKATTTERLGYIGREEGIAVHAVVLLERRSA